MFTSYQNEKKTEYGPRAREVEKATAYANKSIGLISITLRNPTKIH